MSKAAEAAPAPAPVPSGEDSRGASGWKDDWNWKADTEPTVESLLDAGLREAWRDSESVDEEVEVGSFRSDWRLTAYVSSCFPDWRQGDSFWRLPEDQHQLCVHRNGRSTVRAGARRRRRGVDHFPHLGPGAVQNLLTTGRRAQVPSSLSSFVADLCAVVRFAGRRRLSVPRDCDDPDSGGTLLVEPSCFSNPTLTRFAHSRAGGRGRRPSRSHRSQRPPIPVPQRVRCSHLRHSVLRKHVQVKQRHEARASSAADERGHDEPRQALAGTGGAVRPDRRGREVRSFVHQRRQSWTSFNCESFCLVTTVLRSLMRPFLSNCSKASRLPCRGVRSCVSTPPPGAPTQTYARPICRQVKSRVAWAGPGELPVRAAAALHSFLEPFLDREVAARTPATKLGDPRIYPDLDTRLPIRTLPEPC